VVSVPERRDAIRAPVILLLSCLAAFGSGAAAAAAPNCPAAAEVARRGDGVRAARARLMRIPIPVETLVSPRAEAAIEALKSRIVEFATAALRCAPEEAAPAPLQHLLAARGDAFEYSEDYISTHPMPDRYGLELSYEVRRIAHPSPLLAVLARFSIECGNDAVLILFSRSGGSWRPSMIRRSAPYREIGHAYGAFGFAVSAPDRGGRWYLATSIVPPWCSSNWRGLVYDLSRPGPSPARPRIFFRRAVGNYLGNDMAADLRAGAEQFQVRHDGAILDIDILVRRHVETYRVEGDRVRRVQPVALNARDFVDEWIDSPWQEAAAWSAPTTALRLAHRQLNGSHQNMATFGPIRKCAPGLRRVEVDSEGEPAWYFIVRGDGAYRMEQVRRGPLVPDPNRRQAPRRGSAAARALAPAAVC
jgi:hypothetical protein